MSWKLITPYGTVECHKGRSFGERVWKQPDPEKKFGVAYFTQDGRSLTRDEFVHIKNQWIPKRGNEIYAKRIYWGEWEEMGKPKTIDGKKLGMVVKRGGGEADTNWDARRKMRLTEVQLHRFVSRDMKYIIPEPASVNAYKSVVAKLNENNEVLVTQKVQIMSNSAVKYTFAILPIGRYLVYVELLDEDLQRPFPPDAAIPAEHPTEVGMVEEEDTEDII
jgi:hypothetical protein